MTTIEDGAGEQSFDALLEEGWDCVTDLEDCLGDADGLDDVTLERVVGNLETLSRVAEAVESIVETVDFEDVASAIDTDEAIDALDPRELPAVLADEGDASDLVELEQLADGLELLAVWDATELRALWQETDELTDAIEDLGGADAGMLESAVDDATDVGSADDGLLSELEAAEVKEALGAPDPTDDPTAYQVFMQEQAMAGIDAFRDALVITHEKFESLYEFNRERMGQQESRPHSRNPTAVSTLSTERIGVGSVHNHATVPRAVRFSTAPSRRRIYGHRFARERERLRGDN